VAQVGRSQSKKAQQPFVVLAHQVLPGVEIIPKVSAEDGQYGHGRGIMISTGKFPDYCPDQTQRY